MTTQRLTTTALAMVGLLATTGTAASEASAKDDAADAYQEGWGPSVGDTIPALAAQDQDGNLRDLASLSGEGGLVLLVSRSAVW